MAHTMLLICDWTPFLYERLVKDHHLDCYFNIRLLLKNNANTKGLSALAKNRFIQTIFCHHQCFTNADGLSQTIFAAGKNWTKSIK